MQVPVHSLVVGRASHRPMNLCMRYRGTVSITHRGSVSGTEQNSCAGFSSHESIFSEKRTELMTLVFPRKGLYRGKFVSPAKEQPPADMAVRFRV